MLTAITDLRGKGRWTAADYLRQADLWIVASSWTEKPVAKARTLAHLSASYLTLDGAVCGPPGTLNDSIGRILKPLAVPPLWTSDDGRMTLQPVDITARFATTQLADLCVKHMAPFDGLLIDYYVALGWAYPGAYSDDFWIKWNTALRSWVEQMRARRPDWIVIGQVHQMLEPCGALNGLYTEQSLTSFGSTFEKHAADVATFKTLSQMSGREVVCVAELREPARFSLDYQDRFKKWCVENGAYASWGRDATAGVGL